MSDGQRHTIRRIQHDFVAEWVELLSAVRPDLDHAEAQLTVHGVLGMINDVLRITCFRARPRLTEGLTGLSRLLLGAPSA
ncbi:hypothetical protein [Streptomyces sp. NPDC058644]|uniref:hypothetical protein n=1 Tax=unclassified Streptomyces TaxID=2593676 RepID=UPI0036577DB9